MSTPASTPLEPTEALFHGLKDGQGSTAHADRPSAGSWMRTDRFGRWISVDAIAAALTKRLPSDGVSAVNTMRDRAADPPARSSKDRL